MNASRVLWTAAGAFALAGLGLRVIPARLPAAEPVVLSPARALAPAAAAPASGEGIVAGNLFSASRVAPSVRFMPLRLTGRPAAAPLPSRPPFTLYGITVTAQGALALIDADPAVPGAEIYRVGDVVRGGRLIAITDSTVTLSQPSGPLVLRLPPGSRRNP